MLDEARAAMLRQRKARAVRRLRLDCLKLLGEKGELGGMAVASDLIERLDALDDSELDGFFEFLAADLSPDPKQVLKLAQAYADTPDATTLLELTRAAEPPRQELFRRLNRMPGGTAAASGVRRCSHSSTNRTSSGSRASCCWTAARAAGSSVPSTYSAASASASSSSSFIAPGSP